MPLYDFGCNKCNTVIELFFPMNSQELPQCERCGEQCYKVFHVPGAIVDNNQVKTLGTLADCNTERMVKEGKLDKSHLNYGTNKSEINKRKNKKNKIANMSAKQVERYIFEGKE